jgi:signal transduction histidine kinase
MRPSGEFVDLVRRLHLPARSVRVRLTALYGGLFLVSGAGLLTITYALVRQSTSFFPGAYDLVGPSTLRVLAAAHHQTLAAVAAHQRAVVALAAPQRAGDLHQLLVESGVALAIMTVIAAALGWLVAGRVLRPLRTMTATTRRISEDNLHDRLALQGPRDELTDLGDTIDGLLARLEVAFDAQRRFVANASHELRTPLATMRASLDVAMAKPVALPAHIVTLEDRLRHEFDHVERLLESFLSLARAQHGLVTDEFTVALGDIASAAVERRGDDVSRLRLEVEQEQCPEALVRGSEMLLSRMVENVIDNAVCHNEPGGWVRITPAVDGPLASLVVENGGRLLAQDEVDELAQPFRRLGAQRTGSDKGTGLGLSIVASIAQAHGGTLDLRARGDGGLRVMIALPVAVEVPAGARA